jgi:hypothetical protein
MDRTTSWHYSLSLRQKQIFTSNYINIQQNRDFIGKAGSVEGLSVEIISRNENCLLWWYHTFVAFEIILNNVQLCFNIREFEIYMGKIKCTVVTSKWRPFVKILYVRKISINNYSLSCCDQKKCIFWVVKWTMAVMICHQSKKKNSYVFLTKSVIIGILSRKPFLKIATPLSIYSYSIKFSCLTTKLAVLSQLLHLLELDILKVVCF